MNRSHTIYRQKFFLVVLFLLGALLVAGKSNAGADPVSGGRIRGVVTDRASGQPLPGATVRLRDAGRATAADSAGAFSFDELPFGPYPFSVAFLGYAPLAV